jgi:hypothetical protein
MGKPTDSRVERIKRLAAPLPFEERRRLGREIARATPAEIRAGAKKAIAARWARRSEVAA